MKNGQHTFYVIQHRVTAKGGWLKPDSKLVPVKKSDEWSLCGADYWGRSTNPHIGTGNNWRPANPTADKEFHQCNNDTDCYGWYTLKYAIAALKRCRQHDAEGMYNTMSTYGNLEQEVRHEFRIAKVQITFQKSIEPLTVEDVVAAE